MKIARIKLNKNFIQKNKKLLTSGVIVLGVILSFFAFMAAYYLYFLDKPLDKNAAETTFVITKGDGVRKIAANLEKDEIISQDLTFLIYLKLSGLSSSLQAGDYRLSAAMSPYTIADILTKGKVASKKITIPEGWTIDDIGTYLEKQGIVTKADFVAATKKNYEYDFLADKPAGQDLEGYLFPDTYQISVTANAEDIVRVMLDNFDKQLTTETRAAISGSGMNIYETVTLASIVEREVSKPEDRKVVAGIFLNRLNTGMALESCATVQYILKTSEKRLSYEQTRVESPYNTYLNTGLPVGPIGNPGSESIRAVLFPEKTDYYFFFSADGVTYYSKTLEEHNAKVAKYLD